jgi:hypothetical protein
MRNLVLQIIVIQLCSVGGFPLKEASEHCFLWTKNFISSVALLIFCCSIDICLILFFLHITYCTLHTFIKGKCSETIRIGTKPSICNKTKIHISKKNLCIMANICYQLFAQRNMPTNYLTSTCTKTCKFTESKNIWDIHVVLNRTVLYGSKETVPFVFIILWQNWLNILIEQGLSKVTNI